jgi:hypothetical protein
MVAANSQWLVLSICCTLLEGSHWSRLKPNLLDRTS